MASPAWRGQRSRPEDGSSAAAASPLLAELGRSLRQAREARGLEVQDLCRRLRIGVEQLIALESGDRARLPETVFVLAQVRRIAQTLQIDLEPQLRELRSSGELDPHPRALAADPVARPRPAAAEPLAVAAAAAAEQPEAAGGFSPLPLLLGLALLLLGGGALWVLRPFGLALPQLPFGARSAGPERPDRSTPATSAPPPAAPLGGGAAATTPAASASSAPGAAATSTAAARPGPATAPTAARRPPAPASPRPAAPDTLVITARGSSWLEVRNADNRVLYSGLFKDQASFPLGAGLRVMAGRPDLVSARLGNRPPRPLGSISEVRWQSFAPRP